ncbi:MAG: AbrB/MazE/SpoVT family DNA-binding domain-containing protein [Candidatus Heimdallarchaeota archaeon]|nr:AbrB/MazE/SpoVT family DNA-binding domain-containing protein [Candidatus Heimdallarchaeota archaeon]
MKVSLDDKGRITIPLVLRQKLGLRPGEEIILSIINKNLLLRKTLTVDEFKDLSSNIRKELERKIDSPIELEKLF